MVFRIFQNRIIANLYRLPRLHISQIDQFVVKKYRTVFHLFFKLTGDLSADLAMVNLQRPIESDLILIFHGFIHLKIPRFKSRYIMNRHSGRVLQMRDIHFTCFIPGKPHLAVISIIISACHRLYCVTLLQFYLIWTAVRRPHVHVDILTDRIPGNLLKLCIGVKYIPKTGPVAHEINDHSKYQR